MFNESKLFLVFPMRISPKLPPYYYTGGLLSALLHFSSFDGLFSGGVGGVVSSNEFTR